MKRSFITLIAWTLWLHSVFAQNITETKLSAGDSVLAAFGHALGISGDYVVGGDWQKDNFKGTAYIFHRNGAVWQEQARLNASDGAEVDEFGAAVAISGDYVIVGARGDDDKGRTSGSAYIFKRNATSWAQQAKLTASDGADADHFGISVGIAGDYAIIGADGNDDKGDYSGSVYIFKRDGTSWSLQTKLKASAGERSDDFGFSVAIDGDYAIIGSPLDDIGNNFSQGAAYIFKLHGTNWEQQAKLTASDGGEFNYFGIQVAIAGDYAVIGVLSRESAYLYNGFSTVVGVDDESSTTPTKFKLEQNFPNPFNPSTIINYQLPAMSNVELTIYNQLGQIIRILIHESQPAGAYQIPWDGRDNAGESIANGVYLYRFKAGSFIQVRKMVLVNGK